MEKPLRQIVALAGGGFSMEAGNPLLDEAVTGPDAGGAVDRRGATRAR